MAKTTLAFVLGGGGARGALQAGALRALLEAGYRPDLLVGTSIGAANAASLALRGLDENGLTAMESIWKEAVTANLLSPNYRWLALRALLRRSHPEPESRVRDFMVCHGLTPQIRFKDLTAARLIMVAADLNSASPVLFGTDPEDFVLAGLLASCALPPWIRPVRGEGQMLIDGGLMCNLPIEPALSQGATEIIALDLVDWTTPTSAGDGLGALASRLTNTVQQRLEHLELSLAQARGVPVRRILLVAAEARPIWDFSAGEALLAEGYRQTQAAIVAWPPIGQPRWWSMGEIRERGEWMLRWRRAA